jgi:hypothetical protein
MQSRSSFTRDPHSTPSRNLLGVRSGRALGPSVKARAFGMTQRLRARTVLRVRRTGRLGDPCTSGEEVTTLASRAGRTRAPSLRNRDPTSGNDGQKWGTRSRGGKRKSKSPLLPKPGRNGAPAKPAIPRLRSATPHSARDDNSDWKSVLVCVDPYESVAKKLRRFAGVRARSRNPERSEGSRLVPPW